MPTEQEGQSALGLWDDMALLFLEVERSQATLQPPTE